MIINIVNDGSSGSWNKEVINGRIEVNSEADSTVLFCIYSANKLQGDFIFKSGTVFELEVFPSDLKMVNKVITETKERLKDNDRLQIQLAGCLSAAEGAVDNPPIKGEWAWSCAYQAVLDLRLRYEKLQCDLAEIEQFVAVHANKALMK